MECIIFWSLASQETAKLKLSQTPEVITTAFFHRKPNPRAEGPPGALMNESRSGPSLDMWCLRQQDWMTQVEIYEPGCVTIKL